MHTHLVYERLDRAITRKDWLTMYLNVFKEHSSFTCSDHRPIIVLSNLTSERHKAFPFRFQNFWCKHQQVDIVTSSNWQPNFKGTNMFNFTKKLKNVKYEIKGWSKNHFDNFHEKLTRNTQKTDYVEDKLLSNLNSYRLNS